MEMNVWHWNCAGKIRPANACNFLSSTSISDIFIACIIHSAAEVFFRLLRCFSSMPDWQQKAAIQLWSLGFVLNGAWLLFCRMLFLLRRSWDLHRGSSKRADKRSDMICLNWFCGTSHLTVYNPLPWAPFPSPLVERLLTLEIHFLYRNSVSFNWLHRKLWAAVHADVWFFYLFYAIVTKLGVVAIVKNFLFFF